MRRFDRLRRVETLQSELATELERLRATLSRLETEWEDTKSTVRRSYQRMEKAAQRFSRGKEAAQGSDAPASPPDALEGLSDPFSLKLRRMREQRALHNGNHTSAG